MNNSKDKDFLIKLDELLSTSTNLDELSKKNYKNSLEKIKELIETSDQFIQLHWFISQIASETELDTVSLLTLNAFSEILTPDACAIYLIDKNKSLYELNSLGKTTCNTKLEMCSHIKHLYKKHISSQYIDILPPCKKAKCLFENYIEYPLYKRDGDILGYIIGYYKKDINNEFISKKKLLMDIFCIQVGLSIESVILKEKMQTLAFTDELTGLSNKRVLIDRLDVEIDKYNNIQNYNDNGFGVIMIDVDSFKHYNDSFGHIAGDAVLEYLGELINKNITKFDIGARYGGEEMCIILSNKTLDESINFAESLRKQVEETIFEHRKITISLGVSHYPTNVERNNRNDYNNILKYADTCLYHSKNTGKNKVTSSYNLKEIN